MRKFKLELKKIRAVIRNFWCRIKHDIQFKEELFTDVVSGIPVRAYHCPKCKTSYMANHKRDWFRVYIGRKLKRT